MLENTFFRHITNFFIIDSPRSYRIAFFTLVIFIISLTLILINLGFPPIKTMPWDVMIQLDGAWRIINHQIPNVDFAPVIPPFTILMTALGMKLSSPSASSITYGTIILFVILTPWSWFIASSRLSAFNAFLFAVFIGVLLVTPRPLGLRLEISETSYAMLYNRQGWVLISMLFVQLFISPRTMGKIREIRHGLSCGILLTLLTFSKLNFLGISITAIALYYLIFRPNKKWLITFIGSFLILFIFIQIILSLNFFFYFSEMRSISSAYVTSRLPGVVFAFKGSIKYTIILLLPLLINISVNQQNDIDKSGERFNQIRLFSTSVFAIISGVLICSTSAQMNDIPLYFVAGLICLEYFRRKLQFFNHLIKRRLRLTYLYYIFIIIPLFCGTILIKDISNITYSVMWHRNELASIPDSQKFQSKTLANFTIPGYSEISSVITPQESSLYRHQESILYRDEVNEGIALLQKHISNKSRITNLGFSNPYPFALGLLPPGGGVAGFCFGVTFNYQHFPEAEKVFKGANMVMISKGNDSTVIAMKYIYKDYLDKHFIEKNSSTLWTLLVKR